MSIVRNTIFCGDALTVLKTLPDACIQCCVTSPPYYGLRDYGVSGQIGLEDHPSEYIAKLVEVFREVKRVLRPDGTLWLNIGDSYAGGKRGRADSGDGGKFAGPRIAASDNPTPAGFKSKDLMMIPARVAIALQEDGWWVRSSIIWQKPTAMPESVLDRPTTAHEHIFLLAKSERYFYDADAIREPLKAKTLTTYGSKPHAQSNDALGLVKSDNWGKSIEERKPRLNALGELAGANARSVWEIASEPFPGSHFAVMPTKLAQKCVLAGSSPIACEQCSTPWHRVYVTTHHRNKREPAHAPFSGSTKTDSTGWAPAHVATNTWEPTCKCSNNTGSGKCLVLDPFLGAGTVALVALEQNREFIGIELNPAYVSLASKRIATVQPVLWQA